MGDPLTLVIVDNEPLLAEVMTEALTSIGHKVLATGIDGQDAVNLYRKHRPDVLIMDYDMPHLNGLQAAGLIKQEDPDANIVICSGSIEYTHINQDELRHVMVLPKPVGREKLEKFLVQFKPRARKQESSKG